MKKVTIDWILNGDRLPNLSKEETENQVRIMMSSLQEIQGHLKRLRGSLEAAKPPVGTASVSQIGEAAAFAHIMQVHNEVFWHLVQLDSIISKAVNYGLIPKEFVKREYPAISSQKSWSLKSDKKNEIVEEADQKEKGLQKVRDEVEQLASNETKNFHIIDKNLQKAETTCKEIICIVQNEHLLPIPHI